MTQLGFLVALVTVATVAALQDAAPRRLSACRSSTECGDGSCCVIGMQRFSTPTCQPLRQIGDTCRPASDHPIFNRTLAYPNGLEINLKDAYLVICPCDASQGLICNTTSGTCTDDSRENNSIE